MTLIRTPSSLRSATLARLFLMALTTFSAVVIPQWSHARGADSSGGGGTLYLNSRREWVLLDFGHIHRDLHDPRQSTGVTEIIPSEVSNLVGFDRFDIAAQDAMSLARLRLERWKPAAPQLISLLQEALIRTPWRYTPLDVRLVERFVIPKELGDPKTVSLKPCVLYTKLYGAWISVDCWNSVGDLTQAGIIVHEALRQLQIQYFYPIDDLLIQMLTAKIMLTEPQIDRSGSSTPLILSKAPEAGEFKKRLEIWEGVSESFEVLVQESCKVFKAQKQEQRLPLCSPARIKRGFASFSWGDMRPQVALITEILTDQGPSANRRDVDAALKLATMLTLIFVQEDREIRANRTSDLNQELFSSELYSNVDLLRKILESPEEDEVFSRDIRVGRLVRSIREYLLILQADGSIGPANFQVPPR